MTVKTIPVSTNLAHFQHFISNWYHLYGRHDLPWRLTTDPYLILVSELMLQQTQVTRVIPKYQAFIERFPTLSSLQSTQLADVLKLWQGLGYNRRAKYLWQLAQTVDQLPTDQTELQKLPGIGPYTAAAICAFAYNQPVVMIETNIRTVFLYHFFYNQSNVNDQQLLPLIESTLNHSNPRQWYWALMDYGSYLKSILPNPSRLSKHHTKQSTFQGSSRQVRGEIIRLLTRHSQLTKSELRSHITGNQTHFEIALQQLLNENLVEEKHAVYSLG